MKKIILIAFISLLFINSSYSQEFEYDNIGKFGSHGIAWALVQKDNKFGFIDAQGKLIVPVEYDNIGKFGSHGIAWALVQKGEKFGFIDAQGKLVVPVEYDDPERIKIEKE